MATPHDRLLPIKKLIARNDDYYPNEPAQGSAFAPFVPVTQALRKGVAKEIDQVEAHFKSAFKTWQGIPGVARIMLRKGAVAKSYRPIGIFNTRTCPFFGARRLGELYASVTPEGLAKLKERVLEDARDVAVSHLSTIREIESFTASDALGDATSAELGKVSRSRPVKLRLFRHNSNSFNAQIDAAFDGLAKAGLAGEFHNLDYPGGMRVVEVRNASTAAIAKIAAFPGTQRICEFPEYGIVRAASQDLGAISTRVLPAPDADQEYPLVGIIDSGTDLSNELLQGWVEDRWGLVPDDLQDNTHGSFVSGLICNSRALNRDNRFPSCSSRIIDVVAFDYDGTISEQELMAVIRDSVDRYPQVRVWNLSFSLRGPCVDYEFSPMATLIDGLSKERGIAFVAAAGNYDEDLAPAAWPRANDPHDRDRICSPADSPTSVVVGAIAHRDTPSTCVRQEEPSPFSRRGPGAALFVAPQVVHYGGNCADDGDFTQTGIISVDGSGRLTELIGTSFSTPIVASLLANVESEVRAEPHSALLAKALLFHSALLRNAPLAVGDLNHLGVGRPPDLDEIIHCRQDSATIILQCDLGEEPNVAKESFPMPSCLIHDGTLRCEILMTLLYIPPFDVDAGFEYCQTNIEAGLGTIDAKTGGLQLQVPPYLKLASSGYEADLVRNGFKWSPLKFYYRDLKAKNALGDKEWRLQLRLHKRAQFREIGGDHTAYLLATLRDKGQDGAGGPRIYDELVRSMNRLGWAANDLKIRSRSQSRP